MNICMIGTGYVGLVTGTCFAEMGNKVYCIDIDNEKVNKLSQGTLPIFEPGLKELVQKNIREKRLSFSNNLADGLKNALFCFIAVGTPPGENGSADLKYVQEAAREIGSLLEKYTIIVNKSTVPVGTADIVRQTIAAELHKRNRGDVEFDVVSNPEFLKEGVAIEDCMRPDRIVIGVDNVRTAELIKELYEPFVRNQNPILIMDVKSAEMTKYAANAMLATRISFMNELARLCDAVGADINNVRIGIGNDKRIGMSFLYAGTGYGGSCFPKDVKELVSTGRRLGIGMEIAAAVESVNERQKSYLVDMLVKRFSNDLKGKRFAIWGLSFKPMTDDMREAPSLVVINALLHMGAEVFLYDPEAMEQAKKCLDTSDNRITFVSNMMEAVEQADALVLMTEWRQFCQPDFEELRQRMRGYIIFDGRNQYKSEQIRRLGFEYYCIGRNCCVK